MTENQRDEPVSSYVGLRLSQTIHSAIFVGPAHMRATYTESSFPASLMPLTSVHVFSCECQCHSVEV